MFRQALAELLDKSDDIRVVGSAGSAAAGVSAAQELSPEVVLMDFDLPDGNGVDAAAAIRDRLPDTKVVMLTGYEDESKLLAAIEAGCSGYVVKQKAVEEVVSAVRAAHEGEAVISPSVLARLLPRLRQNKRGLGSDLTVRELEVLNLLADGRPNAAIAEALFISLHTVRNHVQNVLAKLQAHSKLEAVAIAVREGIIRRGAEA